MYDPPPVLSDRAGTESQAVAEPLAMAQKRQKDSKQSFPEFDRFIRSMQRIEGSTDCFGKSVWPCKHPDCDWIEYCLNAKRKSSGSEKK